ncbi:unnamed protein product [Adineta ricciae]|uniref:Uncharacterized protein n=1 Tax=Adineta ricciae TaxID=249248 RepID=A0A815LGR2_ADIRI|nr:unnamed protein product [Adineta ricciae]
MLGFNARNLSSIDPQYKCRICSRILRNPVQLNCGHRQCKSCVDYRLQAERIKCPECGHETLQSEILPDRGVKNDMKSIGIQCSLCPWDGLFKVYESHLNEYHANPKCDHCGISFNSITELDIHQTTDCPEITVPCPLKDYGCITDVSLIKMSEHYRSLQHQIAIIAFIRRDVPKLLSDTMDIDHFPQTTTSLVETHNTPVEEMRDMIDVLENGVDALNEDAKRLSIETNKLSNAIEKLNNDYNALKLSIQEQNTYLDGIKPKQDALQQEVSTLQETIDGSQSISYDGTYTWRISGFREKMADARTERQTSIYSPPFYSSPTGYKMRGRIYLNGDGNARRTHISLFFVLMRSEYDAILRFPFSYKVTFCLFDQTPAQRHIIDSFRPDIKSNSFQRPRSEMNIASGIPKFFSLELLQDEVNPYVRDDTMFIKIMVDFGDMPKTLLPFAFSVNPGYTITIQQNLIRKEAERRSQQQQQLLTSAMNLPTSDSSVVKTEEE